MSISDRLSEITDMDDSGMSHNGRKKVDAVTLEPPQTHTVTPINQPRRATQ